MDANVALLQEVVQPPEDLAKPIDVDPALWRTVGWTDLLRCVPGLLHGMTFLPMPVHPTKLTLQLGPVFGVRAASFELAPAGMHLGEQA